MPLRVLHSACVGTMALSGASGRAARQGHGRRARRRRHHGSEREAAARHRHARHAATPAERAQLDRELLVGLRGEVRPIRDLVSRTGDVIRFGPHAFSPGHDYMAGLSVDAARVGDELQFHVREA